MDIYAVSDFEVEEYRESFSSENASKNHLEKEVQQLWNQLPSTPVNLMRRKLNARIIGQEVCMTRPSISAEADFEKDEKGNIRGSISGSYHGQTEDGSGQIDVTVKGKSDGEVKGGIKIEKNFYKEIF